MICCLRILPMKWVDVVFTVQERSSRETLLENTEEKGQISWRD